MISGGYGMYIVLTLLLAGLGMWVSGRLKNKFREYGQQRLRNGLSGEEIAQKMLRHYGINDVSIVEGQGFLTDHYNPTNKTISLSSEVFHGRSVAAAAVAAHETGHAVQHNTAYSMLQLRSKLVPAVSIASRTQQFLFLPALLLPGIPALMLIAIGVFAVTTIFTLITLPVEFDASKRALVWLEDAAVTQAHEHEGAKDALHWAAMTYVVAALASLATLVYLIFTFLGRRN